MTNIDSSDPDQLVYKTLDPADRLPGPAGDLSLNSYLGLYTPPLGPGMALASFPPLGDFLSFPMALSPWETDTGPKFRAKFFQ